MTNTSTSSSEATHSSVIPSEVGWQFVPQYYTFVNKQPNRLHCFYTKSSTFIHGTEGEDGKPCYGQQEIHNKITSIGFEDCKVFIHSVDAQSSANGGIIIQVIGEMSNRGEPWRKFVQTFFLAEQPNGYFVLNDIFRFLKEETVESEDGEGEHVPAPAEPEPVAVTAPTDPAPPSPAPAAPPAPVEEPTPTPVVQMPSPSPSPAPVEEATTAPEPPIEEPATQHLNGHAELEPKEPEPAPVPTIETPATPPPAPAPAAPAATESPAPSASPAPAPARSPAPPQQPALAAAPPQPSSAPAPAAPKTWANLAATNSKKWGSAVAQESRGTSEVPAASSSTPASGTHTPPVHHAPGRPQLPPSNVHPAFAAAMSVPTPQCFVKSVQENVTEHALRTMLTTRFGAIKELEIVRSKACAFLEFTTLDAARRAIAASLPLQHGGEGGLRVDVGEGQQMRITVETRKERGERPVSRPRGGAPPNGGDARGGFRGRGGGGPGRGRGIGTK